MQNAAIPTALTPFEARLLGRIAEGRNAYEAGALLGASTIALGRTARHLVSVDPHEGYPEHRPRPTWKRYLSNLFASGVMERVSPIQSDFRSAPPNPLVEVAFADLTGCGDLMSEFLTLASGADIIAVHDYQRGGCGKSTYAVDAFLRRNSQFRVTRVDTLVVMERRT